MLIELNDNNVKEGVLILKKTAGGKFVASVISKDELMKSEQADIDTLKSETTSNKINIKNLIDKDLPGTVGKYTSMNDRLFNFMAYEVMLDDINYNGVDYPANFEEIKKWVLDPTEKVPDNFSKYINQVKGLKEEETNND